MIKVRKISNRREPAGLERVILRKLPLWCLGGTVVPGLVALLNHWLPVDGLAAEAAKRQFIVDALCYGTVFTVWTAVFTVAIGCYVVVVMKGPHYAADSYPVEHANRPERDGSRRPD